MGIKEDLDKWNNGNDSDYVTTVRINLIQMAWNVLIEDINTPNHVERAIFANKVLNHINDIANKLALILATNDIAATDIFSIFKTYWNSLTGLL